MNITITTTLENAILHRSTFKVKGEHTYRLSGFMYVYVLSDGDRLFAYVNREDANAVSGIGIAGSIVEFGEFEFTDEVTPFSDDYIEKMQKGSSRRIIMDVERFEFLKTIKPNLSRKEYEDFVIDYIIGGYIW